MTHDELVSEARAIVARQVTSDMDSGQKDELLEQALMSLLDRKVAEPFFSRVAYTATGGPKAFGGDQSSDEDLNSQQRRHQTLTLAAGEGAGHGGEVPQ